MQADGQDQASEGPTAPPVADAPPATDAPPPKWIAIGLHAAPIVAVAVGAAGSFVPAFDCFPDLGTGGWRAAAAALLFWAAAAVGRRLAGDFRTAAMTTWWDPAATPDGDLSWEQLLRLVEPRLDPMQNAGRLRRGVVARHVLQAAVVGSVMFAIGRSAASWLALPRLPEFLTLGGSGRLSLDALINLSGNLTAFLALIAAAASLWFANSQLRAKVRADNRRDWLARARKLLADVVALAREHARVQEAERPNVQDRLDALRLRFELMLNPREKDHRLLMHLLRRLAFLQEPARAEAADGGAFLRVLKKVCMDASTATYDRSGSCDYDADWRPIVECNDPAALTTYVMRLGHVVLKREWERVKAAR